MPWSESTKMDEKLKFVARYLDEESISDLCRYDLERSTIAKSAVVCGLQRGVHAG